MCSCATPGPVLKVGGLVQSSMLIGMHELYTHCSMQPFCSSYNNLYFQMCLDQSSYYDSIMYTCINCLFTVSHEHVVIWVL